MTDHSRFVGDAADIKITTGPRTSEARIKTTHLGLQEMRIAAGLTQEDVAEHTGMRRAHISRLENSTDARLSTILSYVEAVGGRLELVLGDRRETLKRVA